MPKGKKALLSGHRSPGLKTHPSRCSGCLCLCTSVPQTAPSPPSFLVPHWGFLIFELELQTPGRVSHCSGALHSSGLAVSSTVQSCCITTVPLPDSELQEKGPGLSNCTVPTPSLWASHKALNALTGREAQCLLILLWAPRPKGLPRCY